MTEITEDEIFDNSVNDIDNNNKLQNNSESGEDDDDDHCRDDNNSNILYQMPLYENSRLTIDESVLELLTLHVHHKLTKATLKCLLVMLHKMLPDDNIMPSTVFKLFQYVENIAPLCNIIRHFYCKQCLSYNQANEISANCLSCNANQENIAFFFEIDICDQLIHMF